MLLGGINTWAPHVHLKDQYYVDHMVNIWINHVPPIGSHMGSPSLSKHQCWEQPESRIILPPNKLLHLNMTQPSFTGKVVRLGDIPWFEAWSLVWQYVAFGADMFLSTFFSRHHIPPDQLEGEGITIARLTAHHLGFPKPLWNTGSILHINWLAWFRSSTVPLATDSQCFWKKNELGVFKKTP